MADWQRMDAADARASDTSSVSVEGLSKAYGQDATLRALDDFTLEFPAGQCTVLLGPSGCGKTTVLRSIAGLITPDSGRITIGASTAFDAASGTFDPPEKRRLGMVFQSYALWPHLSVADNVGYPLSAAGMPKAEIRSRVEAMLDWVGLGGMGGRYVHELSGGQQQRVSLGRAVVGNPRAILFDEPLSNLDARLRERMRIELLGLRQRRPFTSIYVTHDQLEAMTLGDRVVVMRAGRIEQVGTPEDVYKRPRTRFAADFMGIPNLLEGTVRAIQPDGIVVDTVLGPLRTRGWRGGRSVGERCTVALRPTLMTSSPDPQGEAPFGRVIRSVFQGTSTIHMIDVAGTAITLESFSEERHADGAEVSVKPADGAVFALLDD
ncbi:ABC transporter ATP-binding protein [Elioraea sp.]|uniref:ABC transporter ATP-binding protein n=1 Tax=Elioraea sp. TaxID=2185103 RepID=UPI0025BD1757|nr:ABC transporter ATP-binding protein [Elioraea sp.]